MVHPMALSPKPNAFLGSQRLSAARQIAALQAEQSTLQSQYDVLVQLGWREEMQNLEEEKTYLYYEGRPQGDE